MFKYEAEDLIERMEGPMEAAIGAFVNDARANKEYDEKVGLTMNLKGGSFTDFQDITVSLSEEYIEELVDEMEDILNERRPILEQDKIDRMEKIIKVYRGIAEETSESDGEMILFALSAHETAHILWSSASDRKKIIKEIADDLANEGIHEKIGERFAADLDNIIEDGRIERLMGIRYPGTASPLRFKNALMYELSIKMADVGLGSADDEYQSLFATLLYLAKCGLKPYDIDDMTPRMQEMAETLKPLIYAGILANNRKEAYKTKMDIYYVLKDLLVEILKEKSDEMEALEELMEALSELLSQAPTGGEPQDDSDDQSNGGEGITIHIEVPSMESGKGDEGDDSAEDGQSGQSDEGEDQNAEGQNGESEAESEAEAEGEGDKSGDGDDEGDKGDKDSKGDKDGKESNNDKDKNKDKDKDSGKEWTTKSNNNKKTKVSPKDKATKEKRKKQIKEALKKKKAEDKYNTEIPRERQDASAQENLKKEASKAEEVASGLVGDFALSPSNTFVEHERDFDVLRLPLELEGEVRKLKRIVDEFFSRPDFNLRHRDSGVLDTRRLPAVKMNDYNVFKRVGHKSKIDKSIMIVWDGSGSMWGRKQYESAKACAIIEGAFAEHIPLKIINFSERYGVEHRLIKDFDEVATGKLNYSYSFGENGDFGGGNNDGMSIKVATHELLERPERDKILIVLSDGMPTGTTHHSDPKDDVKQVVEEARKEGIEVISIFFGDEMSRERAESQYEYMYKKNMISSPVEEITNNLVSLFKELLM